TFLYLPFSPLIYRAYKHNWLDRHPVCTAIAAIVFIGILPTVCGLLAGAARQRRLPARLIRLTSLRTFEQHHIPTAWDYLFSRIQPAWVVVTLKNQTRIYGYMSASSYVSSDVKERDIFISHTVVFGPDGQMQFVNNTRGVYIAPNEVSVIEFTAPERIPP